MAYDNIEKINIVVKENRAPKICVVGRSGSGKSLLIEYLVKYLHYNYGINKFVLFSDTAHFEDEEYKYIPKS